MTDTFKQASDRAIAADAARLARLANGPAHEPYRGADVTGMPPRTRTVPYNLQTAEDGVLKRLSPRRNRWPEVAKLDARAGELEARAAGIDRRLTELRAGLGAAPARDAEALATWQLDSERGERPQPTAPLLEEQVARLAAERDALQIAVAMVLEEKTAHVERHRERLAADAHQAVAQAADKLHRLLDEAAAARADLAELRHTEVWARLFPEPAAGQTAHTALLVGGLRAPLRDLGIDRQLDAARIWEALRRDADWLVEAQTRDQHAALTGDDGRTAGMRWDGDPAVRAEEHATREAFRRWFLAETGGREPTLEDFHRHAATWRASGGAA